MHLIDIIFPKLCVSCARFGTYLCKKCILNVKQKELVCPNCGKASIGGVVHPLCNRKYGLDGLWSLGAYDGVLQKAILKLKYKWVRVLAEVLVDIILEYWARHKIGFIEIIRKDRGRDWVIVPVPLHSRRQNWRGFNQSAKLGQLLSKRLDLDYCEGLKRVRNTKPQVNLKAWERRKNIKGAFAISSNILIPHYPNILLVDDVWTTGATLKECCYVLKRAGAKKVWAITIAR